MILYESNLDLVTDKARPRVCKKLSKQLIMSVTGLGTGDVSSEPDGVLSILEL